MFIGFYLKQIFFVIFKRIIRVRNDLLFSKLPLLIFDLILGHTITTIHTHSIRSTRSLTIPLIYVFFRLFGTRLFALTNSPLAVFVFGAAICI